MCNLDRDLCSVTHFLVWVSLPESDVADTTLLSQSPGGSEGQSGCHISRGQNNSQHAWNAAVSPVWVVRLKGRATSNPLSAVWRARKKKKLQPLFTPRQKGGLNLGNLLEMQGPKSIHWCFQISVNKTKKLKGGEAVNRGYVVCVLKLSCVMVLLHRSPEWKQI